MFLALQPHRSNNNGPRDQSDLHIPDFSNPYRQDNFSDSQRRPAI